jgi:hypothetical protein
MARLTGLERGETILCLINDEFLLIKSKGGAQILKIKSTGCILMIIIFRLKGTHLTNSSFPTLNI